MKKAIKVGDLVSVEWEDAAYWDKAMTFRQAKDSKLCAVETSGRLMSKNRRTIVIGGEFRLETRDRCRNVTTIPVSCVTRIVKRANAR